MHMPNESTVEYPVVEVIGPHFAAWRQITRRKTAAAWLRGIEDDHQRRNRSRVAGCGIQGNAIYGLRYALPACALFWVFVLGAVFA
jgi:hypothetical protein